MLVIVPRVPGNAHDACVLVLDAAKIANADVGRRGLQVRRVHLRSVRFSRLLCLLAGWQIDGTLKNTIVISGPRSFCSVASAAFPGMTAGMEPVHHNDILIALTFGDENRARFLYTAHALAAALR